MIGTINALLPVQMFHFLVGYLIIKYLFLKPGLAIALEQDGCDQGLRRDLALIEEEVSRQEGIANDQWKRHCRVLSSRMPVETMVKQVGVAHAFPPIDPLSAEEERQLVKGIERTIVNRIVREP